ncbi:hypothetical protein EZL74_03230 [Flavobacterium silvisoli]|uniref:Lipoprotein n=1 Tax=Flavobacterium silvisoli TaxID=2529433 RepID=A0A4V2L5H4_9FLAO|nr:hypothetical protein [Flavobacterium silvisoli]TBX70699.1 hypothetical protein EZL74_03230 [Flavobacterium silvisoli]
MKITTGLAILSLVSAASCGSETPKLLPASELCNKVYKNEIVMCEGIVRLPDHFYSAGGSVTMAFEAPGGKYRIPALKIKTYSETKGEKKNMMDLLPSGYTEEDVRIYDQNGQLVKLGDKIRVTGELLGGLDDWCDIEVSKIEKIK